MSILWLSVAILCTVGYHLVLKMTPAGVNPLLSLLVTYGLVKTVFETIVDSLRLGRKVELRGFGSFRIRNRGARIGRNPKTGNRVEVPPKRIPCFKPGKELEEQLNRLEP